MPSSEAASALPASRLWILSDPPAALITDRNAAVWIGREDPQLGAYVIRHYMPLWRNLLLASMLIRCG